MLNEAVGVPKNCRAAGATPDEMADCLHKFCAEIEGAFSSWTAVRYRCLSGGHLFSGTFGQALAILPTGQIAFGRAGFSKADMVDFSLHLAMQGTTVWVGDPVLANAKAVL
jgi:hypothetical protein